VQRGEAAGVDVLQHGRGVGLDVLRETAPDASRKRTNLGGRGVCLRGQRHEAGGRAAGDDHGGHVTLVLQRLNEAVDLLAEVRQLQRAAGLLGAALRGGHPEAAEDQAHEEGQHDHGEQPARYRPVRQVQQP